MNVVFQLPRFRCGVPCLYVFVCIYIYIYVCICIAQARVAAQRFMVGPTLCLEFIQGFVADY